jgi:enoyl-CoA hydratase/carnithine racemase
VQTGLLLDAREAHRYFLVNEVVPDEQLDAHARAVAARIAGRPTGALRAEKLAAIHLECADYEDATVLGAALATMASEHGAP